MSISFDFDDSAFNRELALAVNGALEAKVRELQLAFDSLISQLNAIEPLPSKSDAAAMAGKASFYDVFEAGPEALMEYLQLDGAGKYQFIKFTPEQTDAL